MHHIPEDSPTFSVAGDAGLKALAAVRHADAAAKLAASHALNFAHYSDVAASEATKAQTFLETYITGGPISTIPSFPDVPGKDVSVPLPQSQTGSCPQGGSAVGVAANIVKGLLGGKLF